MEIILIVAMTAKQVIGKGNTIPWHIPGEQHFFKRVTMGHPLIMGRKTFESIGRPLPGRENIIITRQIGYSVSGCTVISTFDAAVQHCQGAEKVFIIGGEWPFREGLKIADTLLLTVIDADVEGDIYFPEFSNEEFELTTSQRVEASIGYTIKTYRRCRSHGKGP